MNLINSPWNVKQPLNDITNKKELDQHFTLRCNKEYHEILLFGSSKQPTEDKASNPNLPKPPFVIIHTNTRGGSDFSNPLQKIPEIEMQNKGMLVVNATNRWASEIFKIGAKE